MNCLIPCYEGCIKYVRRTVVWWFLLNSRSQKKNVRVYPEYREAAETATILHADAYIICNCMHTCGWVVFYKFSSYILYVIFFVSLPVVICWTNLLASLYLHFAYKLNFRREMAANLKPTCINSS